MIDKLPAATTTDPKKLAGELAERDAAIVQAVAAGLASWRWAPVTVKDGGRVLVFNVLADAVKLDGVRVDVSATAGQQCADYIGGILLTARMADLAFLGATVQLEPSPQAITASTPAMVAHSARVDAQIAKRGGPPTSGLVADVGKDWILTNKLVDRPPGAKLSAGRVAANYGWHVSSSPWKGIHAERSTLPTGYVIQGVGTAHDRWHVDYSQVCRVVSIDCDVDGVRRDVRDVLRDAGLAGMLSSEGVLKTLRQPGVDPPPPGTSQVSGVGADPFASSARYLAGLHDSIRVLAEALLAGAQVQGIRLALVSGYRSSEEQDLIYAQGRTRPGPMVTDVRGGQSWHNFGLAFDVAVLNAADQATWPNDPNLWTRIGVMGESLGLKWGGRFPAPDRPHFEYHPGLSIQAAAQGKRPGVPGVSAPMPSAAPSSSTSAAAGPALVFAGGLGLMALARRRRRGRR